MQDMAGKVLRKIIFFSPQEIRKAMEVFSLQQRSAKTPEEALQKQYQFWSTQPVPKIGNLLGNNIFTKEIFFY